VVNLLGLNVTSLVAPAPSTAAATSPFHNADVPAYTGIDTSPTKPVKKV